MSAKSVGARGRAVMLAPVASVLASVFAVPALAQTWTVTATLVEARSISDDDASGPDDLYWKVRVTPTLGTGAAPVCDFKPQHVDDVNHIAPGWTCSTTVTGGSNATVEIFMELWDHDTTSADDHFDINPSLGEKNLLLTFRPADFHMTMNVAGWETARCTPGLIRARGYDTDGDDWGEVVFSLSSSLVGAPDGDSDSDGLPDSWEVCGLDQDGDSVIDLDLPGMGATPERKDLFVEIDWMVANTGVPGIQHSHEPWLPSLINAWEEMNALRVTNPPPARSGVALRLDVGNLYAGYSIDYEGDGTADLTVPSNGNLDLDSDGVPDIGNLGALTGVGTGTMGGGNALPEDATLTTTAMSGDMFNAGSEFLALKTANFDPIRNRVFHYAVFGHQHTTPGNTSSGLAENCGQPECDDFMVTLGTWPRQRVDADRDGVSDAAGPFLTGPSGLPVDGLQRQHTGTFLHELGHNLALGHGGGDAVNRKPNYLSIMSYSWQTQGLASDFSGDLVADPIARDFDRDGLVDVRSFGFSTPGLANLEERIFPLLGLLGLDERVGIQDQNFLTLYSCPLAFGALPPPGNRIARGTGPIDWDCDGNPNEPNVSIDVNFLDGSGLGSLTGFDDHARIATGGLDFNNGISLEEERELFSNTQRIVAPHRREQPFECREQRTLDFDDLDVGASVATAFAPDVRFASDAGRRPVTVDDAGRNGAATHSPRNSVVNQLRANTFQPMSITFADPQQYVSLYVGRTRTNRPTDDVPVRAVLQAFDLDDLNMGTVEIPLPSGAFAVNRQIQARAIFPDQPIASIELRYEMDFVTSAARLSVPVPEPQQIDDLTFCARIDDGEINIIGPGPLRFGDLNADLKVRAVVATPTGQFVDGEPQHLSMLETPLSGVSLQVDGFATPAGSTVTRPEGVSVKLKAPAQVQNFATFSNWRYNNNVSFGQDQPEIELTLLRDGVVTAVYTAREAPRSFELQAQPIPPHLIDIRRLCELNPQVCRNTPNR